MMIARLANGKTPIAVFHVNGWPSCRCAQCGYNLVSGSLYTRMYVNNHAFKVCTTCRPVEEVPRAETIQDLQSRLLKLPVRK